MKQKECENKEKINQKKKKENCLPSLKIGLKPFMKSNNWKIIYFFGPTIISEKSPAESTIKRKDPEKKKEN